MIRWVLIAAQCFALRELLRRRLWNILPFFAFYLPVAILITVSRIHPADIWYARNVWAPLQVIATGLMIGATVEAFIGDRQDGAGTLAVLILVIGGTALALTAATFRFDDRWLAVFIQVRGYATIIAALSLGWNLALIRIERWYLPGGDYRHLVALTGIFGAKALAVGLYIAAGSWNLPTESVLYRGIDGSTELIAAGFYGLWASWKHRTEVFVKRPDPEGQERRGSPSEALPQHPRILFCRGRLRIPAAPLRLPPLRRAR